LNDVLPIIKRQATVLYWPTLSLMLYVADIRSNGISYSISPPDRRSIASKFDQDLLHEEYLPSQFNSAREIW